MDLREAASRALLRDVFRSGGAQQAQWRVLVVDRLTIKIVSACLQMHELAKEKVLIVESMERGRARYPDSDAIYFIVPSESSVKTLINDFEGEHLYRGAHVFFTQPIPDRLFQRMAESKLVASLKAFKEVNIAFVPKERQVFSLERPDSMREYYSGEEAGRRAAMEGTAEQVASLCATLGDYPTIRYREDCEHNADLAQLVQAKLGALKALEPKLGEEGPPSTLLLLDRGFDPTSPLLHELTLQAMAVDLANLKDGLYEYETQSGKKQALLDDNNDLWVELRHKHIADITEVIQGRLKELKEYADKNKANEVKGMTAAVRKLPKQIKDKAQLDELLQLAQECMDKNNHQLTEVEQSFATGRDGDNKKLINPANRITVTLMSSKFSPEDKVRALLTYIVSKDGISEQELQHLLGTAGLDSAAKATVRNLEQLGVAVVREPGQLPTCQLKRKIRPASSWTSSRWTPVLKDLLEQAMEEPTGLDPALFPSVGQARAGQSASARQYGRFGARRSRLVVFVVGGLSYSEARVAYEVAQEHGDWEVLVGGCQLIGPAQFLAEVGRLPSSDSAGTEGEADKLLPGNGGGS